jgi:hypothetical protein
MTRSADYADWSMDDARWMSKLVSAFDTTCHAAVDACVGFASNVKQEEETA